MFRVLVSVLGALTLAWPAAAQVMPFPGDFRTQEITTADGVTIYLRVGGQGRRSCCSTVSATPATCGRP
jgi:hypothetical protein